MAEIGATLREARMRARIDIHEVESATKIRAKYLRALENEEWDLLPGPTFVRTFLRTYAEYLGLDARMLVEEYKQHFERPGPQDLLPFGSRGGGGGRRAPTRRGPRIPPIVPILLVAAVVVWGIAYGVDQLATGNGDSTQPARTTPTPGPTAVHHAKHHHARPKRVKLRIVPTGTVNVCLVTGGGRTLINSQDLQAGSPTHVFTAKRLKVAFGNSLARMRTGGKTYPVAATGAVVGYDLRPGRAPRRLAAGALPRCTG
jgi:helix-turn-helix protein